MFTYFVEGASYSEKENLTNYFCGYLANIYIGRCYAFKWDFN